MLINSLAVTVIVTKSKYWQGVNLSIKVLQKAVRNDRLFVLLFFTLGYSQKNFIHLQKFGKEGCELSSFPEFSGVLFIVNQLKPWQKQKNSY